MLAVEENGVKLKLNIVDTPGFGDHVNNDYCWEPITRYIKDQYAMYLRKELSPTRDKRIADSRVHCVLYFIAPSGHSYISQFVDIVNVLIVQVAPSRYRGDEKVGGDCQCHPRYWKV
eukprot:Partr_v1_DN26227_c2_g2_i13_m48604 putative Septin 3